MQIRRVRRNALQSLGNSQRLRKPLQATHGTQQRKRHGTANHDQDGTHRHRTCQQSIQPDARQHTHQERRQVEHHAHRADLLHQRQQLVERTVERRVAAKRQHEEEQGADAERDHEATAGPVAECKRGERERQEAHVFGVELDRVAPPILIEHAIELGQQQREDL